MMRIGLFILTNIAILVVFTVVCSLLGVDAMLQDAGGNLNLTALVIFAGLFGMGGSIISLLMSKWIAKRSTGARVIEQPSNSSEAWLLSTVQRQAQLAGIGMPEVAIYDAPDINAFATGANRDNALVAVSTGLLRNMKQDEVEAVLAHEVSHVANGDMITLTLVQGVMNTFVIFLSRVLGHIIDKVVFKNERGYGMGYFLVVMVLQVLLGFLAAMIVAWFSRYREFRADAGGAHLAGRQKMISALERLKAGSQPSSLPKEMAAFGISGGGLRALFATHPPLEVRIAALQNATGAVR